MRVARVAAGVWIFALVLALYPYTGDPASPIKNLFTGATLLILAGIGAWQAWRAPQRGPKIGAGSGLVIAWLACNLLAGFVNSALHPRGLGLLEGLGLTLQASLPLFAGALIALWLPAFFPSAESAWRLGAAIAAAVALSSVYGFAQGLGLDPFPWAARAIEEYRGLPSTYGNPNFAGHALVLAIPLAAGLACARGARWAFVPLALMLAHLYFTHMRGGPLGLAAALGLLACAWAVGRMVKRPLGTAVIACVLALALGGVLAAGALLAHHARSGQWLPSDGSLILRYNGYFGASRMLAEQPAIGHGPGRYAIDAPRYWTPYEQRWYAAEGKRNDHPHNEALEAAVDAGLPGLCLYFAVLLWAVGASLHLAASREGPPRRLGYALAAAFAAFAVDGHFGFNFHVPVSATLFFVLLAMLEGAGAAPAPPRYARAIAVAALPCTVLFAGWALMNFITESRLQSARGGLVWGTGFEMQGGYDTAARQQRLEAVRLAGEGRRLMPWDARFAEVMGQGYLAAGMGKDAAEHFAEAARLAPNYPELHTGQANARLMQSAQENVQAPGAGLAALAQADKAARAALALCPEYPAAEEALGRAMLSRALELEGAEGQAPAAEAAEHLRAALRGNTPRRAELQELLARACLRANKAADAVGALRRAVEADPLRGTAWVLFEGAAARANDNTAYRDALATQIERIAAIPNTPAEVRDGLRRRLADACLANPREAALAAAPMREMILQDPSRLEDWGRFALAHDPASRRDALLALFDACDSKRAPELVATLVRALRGDAAAWTALLDVAPRFAHVVPVPGAAGARAIGWSADLLEAATVADAEARAKAWAAAGAARVAMADWAGAARTLETALKDLPRNAQAEALADYSTALAGLGRHDEALARAKEAQQLGPGRGVVRLNLARRLAEAGQGAAAKFEYDALLSNVTGTSPLTEQIRREAAKLEAHARGAAGGAPQ